eukprot:Skav207463  [mRNA]  locus=scaffold3545:320845:326083:+ [translate_table: standard]
MLASYETALHQELAVATEELGALKEVVVGSSRCDAALYASDRRCLLIDNLVWSEDGLTVQADLISPLGTSAWATINRFMTWDEEKKVGSVTIQADERLKCPHARQFWLIHAFADDSATCHDYVIDHATTVIPVPVNRENEDKIHVLELFAGYYGGWHRAMKHFEAHYGLKSQVISIENDLRACVHFAASHGVPIFDGHSPLPVNFFEQVTKDCVLHADATSLSWLPAVGLWHASILCMSPPCPPWSSASTGPGLGSPIGMIFPETLLLGRWLKPQIILIENVAGVVQHDHYQQLIHTIQHIGYKVFWSGTVELSHMCPVKRPRWLAMLVRIGDESIQQVPLQLVAAAQMMNPIMYKSVLYYQHVDLESLRITDDIKRILSNPAYAPYNKKRKHSPSEVFEDRCHSGWGTLPCFSASYGNQHNMVGDAGRQCLSHVAKIGGGVPRHWHPIEVLFHHLALGTTLLPSQNLEGWKAMGNQIAVPHAGMLLHNALRLLKDVEWSHEWATVLSSFQDARISTENAFIQTSGAGFWVCKQHEHDTVLTPQQITNMCTFLREHGASFMPAGFWWDIDGTHPLVLDAADDDDSDMSQVTVLQVTQEDELPTMLPMPVKAIPCLKENNLILLPAEYDEHFSQRFHDLLNVELFDAYGPLPSTRMAKHCGGCQDFLIRHLTLEEDPAILLAAFHSVVVTYDYEVMHDSWNIHIQGDRLPTGTLINFFANSLHPEDMDRLGRSLNIERTNQGATLSFRPKDNKLAMPPNAWTHIMCAALTRAVFASMSVTTPCPVKLKWEGHVIFDGPLDWDLPASIIESILQITLSPATHFAQQRLVSLGKRFMTKLGDLVIPGKTQRIMIAAIQEMWGGAGPTSAKCQHRQQTKNAVAACLLEQGVELSWVHSNVDRMIDTVGIAAVAPAIGESPGSIRDARIAQLFTDAKIPIPRRDDKGVYTPQSLRTKQRKKFADAPDPANYRINCNYLLNEDGSPTQQIADLRGQTTGVWLTDVAHATPWLQEGAKLSGDELAMIVLGAVEDAPNLKGTKVIIPCIDPEERQVLLHGTMFQFGAKRLNVKKWDTTQVTSSSSKVCAITLWESDWSKQEWAHAKSKTNLFIKEVLMQEHLDNAIEGCWGRTLRKGKSVASIHDATSMQIHVSVASASFSAFLAASGFNRLIRASSFADSWKKVFPDDPVPQLIQSNLAFKLEPLPYGTNPKQLTEWGQAVGWVIKPVRPLGPKTWLVTCEQAPPQQILAWNGQPLLPIQLQSRQQKAQQSAIVAGPRNQRNMQNRQPEPSGLLNTDPWAVWAQNHPTQHQHVAAATSSRAVQGPVEQKFQQQEAKIQNLEEKVTKLLDDQSSQRQQLQRIEDVSSGIENRLGQQLTQAVNALKSELSQSFTQAIAQQSQQFDDNLRSIKALLMSSKRKTKEEGDAEMSE